MVTGSCPPPTPLSASPYIPPSLSSRLCCQTLLADTRDTHTHTPLAKTDPYKCKCKYRCKYRYGYKYRCRCKDRGGGQAASCFLKVRLVFICCEIIKPSRPNWIYERQETSPPLPPPLHPSSILPPSACQSYVFSQVLLRRSLGLLSLCPQRGLAGTFGSEPDGHRRYKDLIIKFVI